MKNEIPDARRHRREIGLRVSLGASIALTMTACGGHALRQTSSGAQHATVVYASTEVMRAYSRAGFQLFSEGTHRFGLAGARPLYLTLVPGTYTTKNRILLRGPAFSVLVFRTPTQARTALTVRARSQLRVLREPWVRKANLLLISRVAIFNVKDDTLAAWSDAKQILARLGRHRS
jgi:hypothetical protein